MTVLREGCWGERDGKYLWREREREPGLVVICLDPPLPSSRPALHEGQDGHHSTRMDIVFVLAPMSLSY